MKRSTERILTTHVGSLVRPPDLVQMLRAKESGQPYDRQELAAKVRCAVAEVVHTQVEAGVDVPSDGEYSKPSFSGYVNERLSGFERRARRPGESPLLNWGRDRKHFREFYEEYDRTQGDSGAAPVVCTAPITYVGWENVIAGTDCGFSQGAFNPRLHASIVWAKLRTLAEGAALATRQLWD